jgi:hypothetical protein
MAYVGHGIKLFIKNKLVKQCFVQNEITYGFFAFQKIFLISYFYGGLESTPTTPRNKVPIPMK